LNKSSTTGVTGVLKGGFAPWYQLNGHMPICKADLKQPYLNTQLIAYIGNKRALLSFLQEIFLEISADSDTLIFFDPFAGSGSVSRLAKAMGFEVAANDWEPYAYAVNRCHVETEASELDSAFIGASCVHRAFDELNNLDHIAEEYIAKYYSPSSTSTADYRTERLFYTKENARFIDRIREAIESKYPEDDSIERVVLLASLIYQAATHANTSGVFKAYHRGFGGFGKDALARISTGAIIISSIPSPSGTNPNQPHRLVGMEDWWIRRESARIGSKRDRLFATALPPVRRCGNF
jgi:adenine-specific DNA-methyltransferase